MQPKELVKLWVDAFNDGDAQRISEFYAENAMAYTERGRQPCLLAGQ